jgi:hypothetical protein
LLATIFTVNLSKLLKNTFYSKKGRKNRAEEIGYIGKRAEKISYLKSQMLGLQNARIVTVAECSVP